jgi:hypothetical protein
MVFVLGDGTPRRAKGLRLLLFSLVVTGNVACRADEAADPSPAAPSSPAAPRLKVQSYQNYETSDRGTQLAVTPHLSWQVNDDLEVTLGPTFYSYLSRVFPDTGDDRVITNEAHRCRPGIDRMDYGAALGYYRDLRRASFGLSAGPQSVEDPYVGGRRSYVTGTLSAGYRLTGKLNLFCEVYHNLALGGGTAGRKRREDALSFVRPGQTILTLGARYALRENESISLSTSAAAHEGAWLRLEANFRY